MLEDGKGNCTFFFRWQLKGIKDKDFLVVFWNEN